MSMDIFEAIDARRSHRAYTPEKLTEEQLSALLDAGLKAPSAINRQPWHFTLVENQELLQKIHDAVAEDTRKKSPESRSPRFKDSKFHVFYHAPAVIFISGEKDFSWSEVDCGIAVENIALTAEGLGLGSVIVGMPKAAFAGAQGEELKKALQFPEGNEFVIAIAIGHPADTKEAHPIKEGHITRIR